jgi:hypothetical protein
MESNDRHWRTWQGSKQRRNPAEPDHWRPWTGPPGWKGKDYAMWFWSPTGDPNELGWFYRVEDQAEGRAPHLFHGPPERRFQGAVRTRHSQSPVTGRRPRTHAERWGAPEQWVVIAEGATREEAQLATERAFAEQVAEALANDPERWDDKGQRDKRIATRLMRQAMAGQAFVPDRAQVMIDKQLMRRNPELTAEALLARMRELAEGDPAMLAVLDAYQPVLAPLAEKVVTRRKARRKAAPREATVQPEQTEGVLIRPAALAAPGDVTMTVDEAIAWVREASEELAMLPPPGTGTRKDDMGLSGSSGGTTMSVGLGAGAGGAPGAAGAGAAGVSSPVKAPVHAR